VEQKPRDIKIPVAVTVFQGEIYQAPKTWTERAYPNLSYFNEVDNGGHFAARGLPQLAAKGRVALACPLSRCVGRSLVGDSMVEGKPSTCFRLVFALPRRKAKRRFCAVSNPAWMPG
jgi:hypothetical protein